MRKELLDGDRINVRLLIAFVRPFDLVFSFKDQRVNVAADFYGFFFGRHADCGVFERQRFGGRVKNNAARNALARDASARRGHGNSVDLRGNLIRRQHCRRHKAYQGTKSEKNAYDPFFHNYDHSFPLRCKAQKGMKKPAPQHSIKNCVLKYAWGNRYTTEYVEVSGHSVC